LRRTGAHPVQVDLFDVEALKQALVGHEAIYHLATKIPPAAQIGRSSAWLENDRLRRDGARNLVEAALAVGTVQTIIYPSFDFLYPGSGDTWLDAQATPVKTATLFSTVEAEEAVARFAESGQRRGISLRLGAFYGPEAPSSWAMLDYARKGIGAFPGARAGYLPQIWLQDAITALLLALTEPVPSGVYDIVDDEPVTRAQMYTLLAHAVGRKHLLVLPDLLMRLMTRAKYADMSRSLRISNRLFKAVSSWQPTVPNARIGWDLMAQMQNK
ncbi:MAG: NAD-dependent epimerase/dehydratase family protein, partial [Ktedonobacteraceae bacterium]